MRSTEPAVTRFGGLMYKMMFVVFEDDYSRQIVLGNLVGHTGSGNANEADTALDMLVTVPISLLLLT